jgi:hypothetical protein
VITRHVEGKDFVVRLMPQQKEEYRIPIDEVYRRVKAAESEALLLGCRIACATGHSGPLRDVIAQDVIAALAAVDPTANALSLLKFWRKAGPILTQDDHRGGFSHRRRRRCSSAKR